MLYFEHKEAIMCYYHTDTKLKLSRTELQKVTVQPSAPDLIHAQFLVYSTGVIQGVGKLKQQQKTEYDLR